MHKIRAAKCSSADLRRNITHSSIWEEVEMKTVTTAMLVVALLIFIGYGKQVNSSEERGQPPKPPGIGLHLAALQENIDAIRQHIKAGSGFL